MSYIKLIHEQPKSKHVLRLAEKLGVKPQDIIIHKIAKEVLLNA